MISVRQDVLVWVSIQILKFRFCYEDLFLKIIIIAISVQRSIFAYRNKVILWIRYSIVSLLRWAVKHYLNICTQSSNFEISHVTNVHSNVIWTWLQMSSFFDISSKFLKTLNIHGLAYLFRKKSTRAEKWASSQKKSKSW